jgi:hypothetical protein
VSDSIQSSKSVVRQEKFVQNSGERSLNWKKKNTGRKEVKRTQDSSIFIEYSRNNRIDLFIYLLK